MTDTPRTPRLMVPRRSLLTGGAVALTLVASAAPLWAAGEGGEGGEAGAVDGQDPTVAFLTLLGLFEAQHRIVAGLYAEGAVQAAQEHLEASHHAYYDDIEGGLKAAGAAPFEAEAMAFAEAVKAGAAADDIAAKAGVVLAAIDAARAMTPAKDQMQAAQALLKVAAGDIEAGVQGGTVVEPQEYRDAWGFSTVAGRWLTSLAASQDVAVAGAAVSAQKGMADVAAQFAGLTATAAPGDPGAMAAAAARVELAAFRLK